MLISHEATPAFRPPGRRGEPPQACLRPQARRRAVTPEAPQCARLLGGVAAAGPAQSGAPRSELLQPRVAWLLGCCDGSWHCGLCGSALRAARRRHASVCGQAWPTPQRIWAWHVARPCSPLWTRVCLSGRGGRASRPYARPRSAYARAWLRAWPLSGACVRASALPWRCARAAWRRPPAAAPAQEAQPGSPVRCLSSSSVGSRRERRAVSHKREAVATAGTYPQNLCITMWTEAPRARKRSAPARACVMMNGFSPAWSFGVRPRLARAADARHSIDARSALRAPPRVDSQHAPELRDASCDRHPLQIARALYDWVWTRLP